MHKMIISLLVFLIPLLFWTFTPNAFNTPKELVLVIAAIILMLVFALKTFTSRTLTLSSSSLRFGLFAFGLVIILNLIINPVGRLESLVGPSGLYLLLALFSYYLTTQGSSSLRLPVIASFIGSTSVLALHTILQLTLLYRVTGLPLYIQARGFTLTGSSLTTLTLLALAGSLALFLTLKYPKFKTWFTLATALHTVAIVALGVMLLPGGELALQILPLRASWNVALDAMKNAKSFFLGVGLTEFPNFFRSVKPLFLNASTFWNTAPSTSSSEVLHLLTTTGMLGLLSFLSLPLLALKHRSQDPLHTGLLLLTLLSGLTLVLTPGSIPVLFIFFTSLGLVSYVSPSTLSLTRPASLGWSLLLLVLAGYLTYTSYLFITAERSLRIAQLALSRNDGKKVYESHLKAIQLFPQMASYRLSYSQVNLSLASALSQKKAELTDAERQNVTQLISQAIREAKLTANLSPRNSLSWQNLGNVYKNLINVADGVDQFAIDAYAQAVALDPGNPALRIEFGGLLYQIAGSTKKPEDQPSLYNRAQGEFQTAIQLKPDYPNAYYNLSKLLETTKDYQNAVLSLQKAISLLGPESPDLARATSELSTLQTKLPPSTPSPSQTPNSQLPTPNLTTPSPLPSPLPGGPIDLP